MRMTMMDTRVRLWAGVFLILSLYTISVSCQATSVSVRLVGGTRNTEGRVEVFFNGTWGTICDDGWTIEEAQVICRMLTFNGHVAAHVRAYYGQGSGQIWLDDTRCTGREPTIAHCGHSPWGTNNCHHTEDAGVDCDTDVLANLPIRLVGGNDTNEGRLEIQYTNEWGTVCSDGFSLPEAQVVCKQLHFNNSIAIPITDGRFGPGQGKIWLDDMACTGNEKGLGICRGKKWNKSNCNHNKDVGVVCTPIATMEPVQVRLAGGISQYEGRLEIRYGNVWGTVCDDSFGTPEAMVACRMAGFSGGIVLTRILAGANIPIWLDDLNCGGNETSLVNCVHKPWGQSNCQHNEDVGVRCTPTQQTNIQVRLAGGHNSFEGRVEILYKGQWGTVCDDLWSVQDATVVCRMLHLSTSGAVAVKNGFPAGTGQIWLDDLRCRGTENSLSDCPSSGFGVTDCQHNEDAGVRCQGAGVVANNVSVRLVGGPSSHEGRVEVMYKNNWGTVCDDYFGMEEAIVICRMLGFQTAGAQAFPAARYGQGRGQILLDDLRCNGNEQSLDLCRHTAWGHTNCQHSEDASVKCLGGTAAPHLKVRLVGGSSRAEGRLEVQKPGSSTWGTVCDDSWTTRNAQVVCRTLGLPWSGAEPREKAFFGPGTGQILLDDVICTGNESSIDDCRHSPIGTNNCNHAEDVGVVCQTTPSIRVRLRGGTDTSQGRVEVYYNRTWGTICDTGFGNEEAAVVCRMLGFNQPGAIPLPRSLHGRGIGPVYFDGLTCLGTERNLAQCAHKGIGSKVPTQLCRGHTHDAGVKCNPSAIQVRLQNGTSNSGRLEINILGTWDTVCDDSFSTKSAAVACRMLGLNPVGANAFSAAHFGPGAGKIALDDVVCRGNETSLLDCRHSPLFTSNCQHSEDVGISCAPGQPSTTKVRLVGGSTPNEGRVEVFYNNTWGTVCDDRFTDINAKVVCKWLKINAVQAVAVTKAGFGAGRGLIALDDVHCQGTEADLWHCVHRRAGLNDCQHSEDAGVRCLTADMLNQQVRLVNGSTSNAGRVEVFYNHTWGTVCDDQWGVNEARTVCRKLGLETRFAVPIPNAYYGEGTGPVILDDVVCNGSEPSLTYCTHKPFGVNDCEHNEDAGVICLSAASTAPVKVRLVGGLSANQGRVEVLYQGIWGTISDDSFDVHEAVVICKMLGYQRGGKPFSGNHVGSGSGPIWLDDLYCTGTETNIADCRRKQEWGETDVSRGHDEDAGVICSTDLHLNFTARLVNGPSQYEGRVELFYNNQWGTICDDHWDNADAAVVCSMLGFGTDGAVATTRSAFGPGNGSIILDEVQCVGTERNLALCRSSQVGDNDCQHTEDAGVRCNPAHQVETNIRVRLVHGHDSNSGRVEVFYNNTWGTVCDDYWTSQDAQVVCRMLGKPSSGAIARSNAFFQRGSGRIWLDDVHCLGNETSLSLCRHIAWGRTNCQHNEDAGVECIGSRPSGVFRLVGREPWAGRLEVFYNGRWGTVCDDSFGTEEAQVACRSLGFGVAGASARGGAYFGQGSGTIVLDDVVCRGNEADIFHCRHSTTGRSNCNHREDVGVSCPAGNTTPSNETVVRLVNGPTPNQGRLEVKINGTWGTVCDDLFNSVDAAVVCAMLGYPRSGAVAKPQARPFGRGSGPILLDDVRCTGQETSILTCRAKVGSSNCNHNEDVGVVCSPSGVTVRLEGGPNQHEGRVEIQVNGTWGTICDDSFTSTDAQVVCKMLSLPYLGATFYGRAHYGQGSGPIWLDELRCSGRETSVLQCRSSGLGRHDCHHTEDVGVVCSNHRRTSTQTTRRTTTPLPTPDPRTTYVRLVNGPTAYEGRVEIWNSGSFGTVCDRSWDTPDAGVVCGMLGYSRTNAVAKTRAAYGQGMGRIWLNNMQCGGNEHYLAQCRNQGWQVHNCGHQNDAGVKCSSDARPNNFILAVTQSSPAINRMDLNTYSYVTIPHDAHSTPMDIAYDQIEARVYWTDIGVHEIRSSNLDGSERKTVSQLGTRSTPDGIAIDSISRNLYYTDRYSNIIGVMTLDGQVHNSLITSGLDQPRGIAVHAKQAIMFWTDWGRRPKIERSNLDGTSRRTIVSTSLRWPNGITIGYQENKIYWCDAGTRRIESSDFNGGGRRTLISERRSTAYLGIMASSRYLYYTNTNLRNIMRIGKNGVGNTAVGPASFRRLFGITLHKVGLDPSGTNACSQGKGGCAYLCVPTPGNGKKCLCPDGLTLQTDGVSCSKNVPCPPLPAPNFGTLSPATCTTRSAVIGTVCTASCNSGFTINGPSKVTCLANGQWSTFGSPLKCADSKPPTITCPKDMSVTADRGSVLAIVRWNDPTVSDNSGAGVKVVQSQQSPATLQEGQHTVFVTATDTSGHSSSCTFSITVTVKRCPQLTLPAHAYLATSCQNNYGSTCPLQCHDGYTASQSGNLQASCDLTTGGTPQWTVTVNCQAVTCSALSSPSQATISGCNSPYKAGAVCSQSCQSGCSQTGGSESRQCLQDGTWSGQPIVCTQEVTCNALPTPQFGGMLCQAPYVVGTVCTQTCTTGFVVTGGDPVRQCEPSGQWSGAMITCQKGKSCTAPPKSPHGKVTGCVAPFSAGVICSQSCDVGFVQKAGTITRQCAADGTWSGAVVNCAKATTCPLPDAPINGKLLACKVGSSIGALCLQTCNTGFEAVTGSPVRQCKADGTWNGQKLNCTKIVAFNQSHTGAQTGNQPSGNNGGNDNTPAVIILAVLVSLLIVASVIAGLYYFKRRSSGRLTNLGNINESRGSRAFEMESSGGIYNPTYG